MALSGCDSAMDRYLRHTGTPGQLLDVDKQDKVAQVTPVIRVGGGLEMKNLKSRPAFLLGALLMFVIADANVRSRIGGGPADKRGSRKEQ